MSGKRYGVIEADPAWRYRNAGCRGAAEGEYSAEGSTEERATMSMDDIAALPVPDYAADDCLLGLWATWPLLLQNPGPRDVIESWGFEYVTGLPWIKIEGYPSIDLWGELQVKPQYGTGFWVRGCSEPLLLCRRGKVKAPGHGLIGLLSPNFGHSRKPENFSDLVRGLPGPNLEMFARRVRGDARFPPRAGWDAWGNQTHESITMAPRLPASDEGLSIS